MRKNNLHWLLLALATGATEADDEVAPTPGLVQSQFVGKKHISAPTGISVSPQGVVFVSCDINGTTTIQSGVGRVVRCEDTDGDGVADKFSNFVEGIDSPRGSCWVDDTLYLVQPPLLVAWEDPNDDGVAEKRTVLVTNLGQPFGEGEAVHGPNGVRMGIDGWLYLAIGDQGCFEAAGTDGSQATLQGGGVLRVRPDGSQLSVLVTGTRNIYDLAIDPNLDLFARDNTNDGGGWNTRLHHLIEFANLGYPNLYRNFAEEAMPSLDDYGAGAGTGMYFLNEPGFPEGFGEALYSGDFNTGVHIHRREAQEESFRIQQERFMDLPKNTGIDVDGFSRMYFASWSRGGFGFSNKPFGRIDLVQPEDRSAAAVFPDINQASDADLLTHLGSASQVTRINAMREMVTRGSKPTFSKGLLEIAKDGQTHLYARGAAVMTLKQLDGANSHAELTKLFDNADIREFVVRALGDVEREIDDDRKKIFLRALEDENPRVRMRAIVALARSGDTGAAAVILPLAKTDADSTSRAIPHTALKAVVKLNAVDFLLSKLDDPELRETALRGLQQMHSEKVVTGLSAKIGSTEDRQLLKLITITLFRLYHQEAPWDGKTWWGHRPNFKGPYFKCATWGQTPSIRSAIRAAFQKVHPNDYPELFVKMRLNQVSEHDLDLEIEFDEVLSFLDKDSLTFAEHTQLLKAATDKNRAEKELLEIYDYFKSYSFPESYHLRVQILRKWGESKAAGELQR
ncbi:MAG: HEAT repeat domain-containing protein, partial [Verrucomicrobiota bacterium]